MSSALQVDPTTLLCISENMFVHNNSKHGRKIRRIDGTEELAGLYPHTLVPQVTFLPLLLLLLLSNQLFFCRSKPSLRPKVGRPGVKPSSLLERTSLTAFRYFPTLFFLISQFQNIQVIFGTIPVWSELITNHAIRVQTPPRHIPGKITSTSMFGPAFKGPLPGIVEVSLAYKSRQFSKGAPGRFVYVCKFLTHFLQLNLLSAHFPHLLSL